jgi:hypothetical protein
MVHVSTCYVNINKPKGTTIHERIYPLKHGEVEVDAETIAHVSAPAGRPGRFGTPPFAVAALLVNGASAPIASRPPKLSPSPFCNPTHTRRPPAGAAVGVKGGRGPPRRLLHQPLGLPQHVLPGQAPGGAAGVPHAEGDRAAHRHAAPLAGHRRRRAALAGCARGGMHDGLCVGSGGGVRVFHPQGAVCPELCLRIPNPGRDARNLAAA